MRYLKYRADSWTDKNTLHIKGKGNRSLVVVCAGCICHFGEDRVCV